MFEAKMILDSVCNGQRLTTMQLTHPRIVHAEMMTHCMFARNSSSSRAIPFKKILERVVSDPFIPEHWGINQTGMQAFTELEGEPREKAIQKWLKARDEIIRIAKEMAFNGRCEKCNGTGMSVEFQCSFSCDACDGVGIGLNVHKQIVNRLLEPWSWITVCVTGDAGAWSNYFALRCHPDAQPEIQTQAFMAQKLYFESRPTVLQPGQWHTPYIRPDEFEEIRDWVLSKDDTIALNFQEPLRTPAVVDSTIQISTGRCARTSYLTQEGTREFAEDIKLHDRLRYHTPLHACYDEDTEVLTSHGWVRWTEVNKTDALAAFNLETETISFEIPTELHIFPYQGNMYHVAGQAVDLMVTPNHNMVIKTRKRGGSWSTLRLLPAEEAYNKSVAYVKTGVLSTSERQVIENPFHIDPIKFARFVGFFLGDGHAAKDTANVVVFHLHKKRKVDFLKSLSIPVEDQAGNTYAVKLPGISKWCREHLYTKSDEKILPHRFYRAPPEQVQALFDGFRNSDGSAKRNSWVYLSTSRVLADGIQLLATLNGVVVSLNQVSETDSGNPVYCLNFSNRNYPRVEFVKGRSFTYTNEYVPYNNRVYCATVSTGALVVRRKNKVVVSGNSPFEHVCLATGDGEKYAKYTGWKSYRHMLPKEYVTDFQPNHPDFTVAV